MKLNKTQLRELIKEQAIKLFRTSQLNEEKSRLKNELEGLNEHFEGNSQADYDGPRGLGENESENLEHRKIAIKNLNEFNEQFETVNVGNKSSMDILRDLAKDIRKNGVQGQEKVKAIYYSGEGMAFFDLVSETPERVVYMFTGTGA
jgi:hypothetical protein